MVRGKPKSSACGSEPGAVLLPVLSPPLIKRFSEPDLSILNNYYPRDRNPIAWQGLGNVVISRPEAIKPLSEKDRKSDMSMPETLVWGLAGGAGGGGAGGEMVEEDYVWQTACASLQEVASYKIISK